MTQIQENENPITIDTLAVMINNGFTAVRRELYDVRDGLLTTLRSEINDFRKETNERFESLEKKMDQRFNGVQNQLDNIYLSYTPRRDNDDLKLRMIRVERKVGINATT